MKIIHLMELIAFDNNNGINYTMDSNYTYVWYMDKNVHILV